MSAQGHRQMAAHASVDALSREAMLRAAQADFEAAALLADPGRMAQARKRAHADLEALLDCVERQKRNTRMAMLIASSDEILNIGKN